MQKMIIGERLSSPLELTISQIVLGIFAGAIGSIILAYCGVIFEGNSGIELIFLISVFLMFWSPRFICFAYSGAALGLISFILNDLRKVYGMTPLVEGVIALGNGFLTRNSTDLPPFLGIGCFCPN
jgi:hypothetical protein